MKINKGPEQTKAILKPGITVNTGFPFLGRSLQALPWAHYDLTWPKVLVVTAGPGGLDGTDEGPLREVRGQRLLFRI